jgi:hypothetical protein
MTLELEGVVLDSLQSLPFEVAGAWSEGSKRVWRGTSTSAVPLVAMSFLKTRGQYEWCKSEKKESAPTVQLALFPHDDAGMDVQVNFSVGRGGRLTRSKVPSPSYRPELLPTRALQTGRVERFATIAGVPEVEAWVLFLAREDVESMRGGLWRVRSHLHPGLPEPFRQWLSHGRVGAGPA